MNKRRPILSKPYIIIPLTGLLIALGLKFLGDTSKKKVVVSTDGEVVGSVHLYGNGNSINIGSITAGGEVTISIVDSGIDDYSNIINDVINIQSSYDSDESYEGYTIDEKGNVIIIQRNTIRKH